MHQTDLTRLFAFNVTVCVVCGMRAGLSDRVIPAGVVGKRIGVLCFYARPHAAYRYVLPREELLAYHLVV